MNRKNFELNKLFDSWQSQYNKSENFVRDGIINEDLFEKASRKILFITKEPNDPKQEAIDYREWWNKEVYFGFSYRIAEWAYGILNDFPKYDDIWPEHHGKYDETKALEAIQSIAFMNVKKSGGEGQSKKEKINEYVKRDIKFIYKEIEIINPEIIITGMSWGSTIKLLFPDVKWVPSGYAVDIGMFGNHKVIDFYHPSARNGVSASYSLLQNIINSNEFKNL